MFTPAPKICAKQTIEAARIETTEMSISPVMTTNVSPNAIRPMKTYGVTRSSRFARLRKNGESVAAPDADADDRDDEQCLPAHQQAKRDCLEPVTLLPPAARSASSLGCGAAAALPGVAV